MVSQSSESIQLNVLADDVVAITYSAEGRVSTNVVSKPISPDEAIEFLLVDPSGETVLEIEARHENQIELRIDDPGSYQMVFTNPNRLAALVVDVNYAVNP